MRIWNRRRRTLFDDAESLSGSPPRGLCLTWLVGVGLALIPICYGVHCIFARHATLFGRSARLVLHAFPATSLAVAYIAVGAFAHFHWFWGTHPRLHAYSDLGKLLSLIIFLPSFGYAIFSILSSFIAI